MIMYTDKSHQGDKTADLAAELTDLALKALAGVRMPSDSVEAELRLWHTIEAELERDHRWQRPAFRHGEVVAVGKFLQQVVRRAARRVAGAMGPVSEDHAEWADGYLCRA
jgi:hypothetical protein